MDRLYKFLVYPLALFSCRRDERSVGIEQSWKQLPLFLIAGLAISSCMLASISDEKTDIDRQPMKLNFSVGDEFVFNNPDVRWNVFAVRGGRVHWMNNHGDFQITDGNPLLSAIYWSNAGSNGRRIITNKSGHLFPIRVGSKFRFRESFSIDKPPYGWDYDWNCEVIERSTKAARSKKIYVTFKVVCSRQSGDTVIFLYAPKVGHYVSVTRIRPGETPQVRELVSYKHATGNEVSEPSISSVRDSMRSLLEWKIATSAPPILPKDLVKKATQIEPSQPRIMAAKRPPPPRLKPKMKRTFVITKKTTARPDYKEFRKSQKNIVLGPQSDGTPQTHFFGHPKLNISVHLATYKNLENAEAGWRQLIIRHRENLGTLKPRFVKIVLESRGTLYKLHAFPFETRNAASRLCGSLRERGTYCKINDS